MSPEQLIQLTRSVQANQIKLSAQSTKYVDKLWSQVDNVGDAAMSAFSQDAAAAVAQFQRASALQTQTYLAQAEGLSGASAPDYASVLSEARQGASLASVYERPLITARQALSVGKSLTEALGLGRNRALAAADLDVTLASRETARQFADRPRSRIVGWRRMPDPGACAFCLMASTQRYHANDLMPIHTHCHCVPPMPIIGSADPGRVIDKDLLAKLKQSGTTQPTVKQHGELGPVLVAKGDKFTKLPGPSNSELVKLKAKLAREQKKLEATKRWNANVEAARANGGLVEIDPKTGLPKVAV